MSAVTPVNIHFIQKSSGGASAGKFFQQIVREFLVTSKRDPGRPNLEVAKNVKISHRHNLPHLCKETFSLCIELTILMPGVSTSVTRAPWLDEC